MNSPVSICPRDPTLSSITLSFGLLRKCNHGSCAHTKIYWHNTSFETMADILTMTPPQDPALGVMVENNTEEMPSTLTRLSMMHGKHRRKSKVKFFCPKTSAIRELTITSHIHDCNCFSLFLQALKTHKTTQTKLKWFRRIRLHCNRTFQCHLPTSRTSSLQQRLKKMGMIPTRNRTQTQQ